MGPPTSVLVAVVAGADVGGLVGVEGHCLVVVVVVGVVDVHLGAAGAWCEAGAQTGAVQGTVEPQPSRCGCAGAVPQFSPCVTGA